MRKKIIGVAIMAAIAVTAGWNISQNENEVKLSDLALDNVEALASGRSSATCCPDEGDSCKLSTGDVLMDQDEC